MGAPADRAFAEIIGKADGLCGGKGGSMHLTDVSVGAYGSFAIVGAHLPIALGLAFASQLPRSRQVTPVSSSATARPTSARFHEALNLAAIWKLPVIFVCENNLYGEYSADARRPPRSSESPTGPTAYAMAKACVDGNDVLAVSATRSLVAAAARPRRRRPTLIEALTYRHEGHSRTRSRHVPARGRARSCG